jgi:2-oxoglutarate ferredoxin oxidoreductase subunit alpha
MAIPGTPGGIYIAESLEHNEHAHPDYSPETHEQMMQKRRQKIEAARTMMEDWETAVRRWGNEDAVFGVMGWGSTRGAVREAMAQLQAEGIKIEALYPHCLMPMPDKAIRAFLQNKKAILVPELNFTNQFARIVEHRYYDVMQCGTVRVHHLAKAQGIPFKVSEIYNALKAMIVEEGGQA